MMIKPRDIGKIAQLFSFSKKLLVELAMNVIVWYYPLRFEAITFIYMLMCDYHGS